MINPDENKIVFVSEKGDHNGKLYIDGEEVKGIRKGKIEFGANDIVTHEIKFITCKS